MIVQLFIETPLSSTVEFISFGLVHLVKPVMHFPLTRGTGEVHGPW